MGDYKIISNSKDQKKFQSAIVLNESFDEEVNQNLSKTADLNDLEAARKIRELRERSILILEPLNEKQQIFIDPIHELYDIYKQNQILKKKLLRCTPINLALKDIVKYTTTTPDPLTRQFMENLNPYSNNQQVKSFSEKDLREIKPQRRLLLIGDEYKLWEILSHAINPDLRKLSYQKQSLKVTSELVFAGIELVKSFNLSLSPLAKKASIDITDTLDLLKSDEMAANVKILLGESAYVEAINRLLILNPSFAPTAKLLFDLPRILSSDFFITSYDEEWFQQFNRGKIREIKNPVQSKVNSYTFYLMDRFNTNKEKIYHLFEGVIDGFIFIADISTYDNAVKSIDILDSCLRYEFTPKVTFQAHLLGIAELNSKNWEEYESTKSFKKNVEVSTHFIELIKKKVSKAFPQIAISITKRKAEDTPQAIIQSICDQTSNILASEILTTISDPI